MSLAAFPRSDFSHKECKAVSYEKKRTRRRDLRARSNIILRMTYTKVKTGNPQELPVGEKNRIRINLSRVYVFGQERIRPRYFEQLYSLCQFNQFSRKSGENPHAVFFNSDEILNSYSSEARDIDSRLDGDNHSLLDHRAV